MNEQFALLLLEGKTDQKIKNILLGKPPKKEYNFDDWCNCTPDEMKYLNMDFPHYIQHYTGEYGISYHRFIPDYVWQRFGEEPKRKMVIDVIGQIIPEQQYIDLKSKADEYHAKLGKYFEKQRQNNAAGLHCDYNNPPPTL